MNSAEMIIIGGGIHGTLLSHAFTKADVVDPERLVVLDPDHSPLANWCRTTAATGMTHLRSPSSHNLDLGFGALREYARNHREADTGLFVEPYARPELALFNEHALHVVQAHRLDRFRVRGTARSIELVESNNQPLVVHTNHEPISTRRVVLAVGAEGRLVVPEWSSDLAGVRHVFDDSFDVEEFLSSRRPVIIGGGISAVQLALRHGDADRPALILSPHEVRVAQFDSNPCFIGPACLPDFDATDRPDERGETIMQARHPGSIPPDLAHDLEQAIRDKRVEYRTRVVNRCTPNGAGEYALEVAGEHTTLRSDYLVLATGFRSVPDSNGIIARAAATLRLATDHLNRPILDRALRWRRDGTHGQPSEIYVTGRAGELGLGPAAPNIIGAHMAARRIVPYLSHGEVGTDDPWTPLRL